MPFVYVLRCADDSFYTGSTARGIDERVWEHNHDERGAAYTRRRRPVKLAWCAFDESIERVFAWEKQIQGWSRAKKQALVEGRMSDLPGLSRSGAREVTSTSSVTDLAQQGTFPEPVEGSSQAFTNTTGHFDKLSDRGRTADQSTSSATAQAQ